MCGRSVFFFFSSRRRHTRCREVSWARRCVQETAINIPQGVENGATLRFQGLGHFDGDLLVKIKVKESLDFRREGSDIHTYKEISISQAVLGLEMDVGTNCGLKKVKISSSDVAAGSRRIKGCGILRNGTSKRGDHIVHLSVKIPKKLTNQQRAIFKIYAALEDPINPEEVEI
eukprot:TRINITY_DN66758_c0_g1_i1.p1 TRINITY_DN66758_c0_g1~~TRINITY_DN66758_c0_g1_i1.p1  ORF type:complete len:173 (-),score=47.99 TRINITY_DN66758_c0_g1_i1:55-573(-)